MKKILLLAIISFGFVASFGQLHIAPSIGYFAGRGGKNLGLINIEISHPVSDLFAFGLMAEYLQDSKSKMTDPENYSNVVFEIKTDLSSMIKKDRIWDLFVDTGFGWGHHFTADMVDHNFNTYRLGLDYRQYDYNRRVGLVAKVGTTCRSRNEHMIDRSSVKLYLLFGVCLSL